MRRKKKYRLFDRYLDDGERALYIAHRHILIFKISAAKTTFFGLVIPAFLYLLFPGLVMPLLIWTALGIAGIIYHFLDWYFDVWILTNLGIIDLEYKGLFDFTSTRIEYHMIEGIAYNIKGLMPTVFNYGDMIVDKLGAQTQVTLKDAASPKKLERRIMNYQERYVSERSVRDHNALKGMLAEMIAYHVQNGSVTLPNED